MIGQHRSTHRKQLIRRDDEDALISEIIRLAERFGRCCCRPITALLRDDGWQVNEARATVAVGRVSAVDGLPYLAA